MRLAASIRSLNPASPPVVAGAGALALVGGVDDDGSDGGDDEQDDNEAFGRRALRGLRGQGVILWL